MNRFVSIAFALALSAASVNLAKADQQGRDWMPALHVMDKVLNSGYTHVTKL